MNVYRLDITYDTRGAEYDFNLALTKNEERAHLEAYNFNGRYALLWLPHGEGAWKAHGKDEDGDPITFYLRLVEVLE